MTNLIPPSPSPIFGGIMWDEFPSLTVTRTVLREFSEVGRGDKARCEGISAWSLSRQAGGRPAPLSFLHLL